MKYFLLIFTILSSTAAFAAAAGGHGDHGAVPTKLIVYQTINVAIMVFGLIYFLKEPVRNYFKEKRAAYMSAATKAEAARKAAENEREQIQTRLAKLESSADESIARARAEAADMKKQLITEAEALSKRIQQEAQESARLEVERARNHLREAMIQEALVLARGQLASKVTAEDHKRLQSNFIHNIQAVQK